jgi:hypothetical protein
MRLLAEGARVISEGAGASSVAAAANGPVVASHFRWQYRHIQVLRHSRRASLGQLLELKVGEYDFIVVATANR